MIKFSRLLLLEVLTCDNVHHTSCSKFWTCTMLYYRSILANVLWPSLQHSTSASVIANLSCVIELIEKGASCSSYRPNLSNSLSLVTASAFLRECYSAPCMPIRYLIISSIGNVCKWPRSLWLLLPFVQRITFNVFLIAWFVKNQLLFINNRNG